MSNLPEITHHITLTGHRAGETCCGISRVDNTGLGLHKAQDGKLHSFSHAPYAPLEACAFKDRLCTECKSIYYDA